MQWQNVAWGMISGLIGSLGGVFILWGAWLLLSLGLLLTRVNLIYGGLAIIFLGIIGGALYSLVLREYKLNLLFTILSGVILGAIFWVLGVLILVPIILGFGPLIMSPQDHLISLVAFALYGVIMSLLYSTTIGKSKKRLYYSGALLAISLISVPIMLRTATNTQPDSLQLQQGYQAEVVAKGFIFPTSIALDEKDRIYIAEAGYSYGPKTTEARVLIIEKGIVKEFVDGFEGPINGITINNNKLYVSHRGKITEVDLFNKSRNDLITDLPSLGDHQNNDLLFDNDGILYFGQGTATNAGVVGHDNFVYAWADKFPLFHDMPSRDFDLTEETYEPLDLSTVNPIDKKTTGAFSPFGTSHNSGKSIKGQIPASGAIHKLDLKTGELQIYCDGLRNPYGLALAPDGSIYATNLGYDDRGVRAVKNSPDWIVKLKEGAWYGWPDFAGVIPLSDDRFSSERGINLNL